MLIADLSHFEGADPERHPGGYRLGRRLGEITYAATSIPSGRVLGSALRCRRRPGRPPCPGHLRIARPDLVVPPTIEWQCSECRDGGVITGWEHGTYDLRPVRDFDRPLLGVEVSDVEHKALREIVVLDPQGMRVVWGAHRDEEGQLWLVGDEEEFEALSGFVAFEADHISYPRRRRILDCVFGKLEPTLLREERP